MSLPTEIELESSCHPRDKFPSTSLLCRLVKPDQRHLTLAHIPTLELPHPVDVQRPGHELAQPVSEVLPRWGLRRELDWAERLRRLLADWTVRSPELRVLLMLAPVLAAR